MVTFWFAAILGFLILEGVTAALTSLLFALGSLAALISAYFGAPEWLQVAWFVIISGITLFLARPAIQRNVNIIKQATNADRLIGMTGIVTETINNLTNSGLVSIGGKQWTARSLSGEIIEPGTVVRGCAIEGVKLIVTSTAENLAASQQSESE